jgi:phosphatidylglycerophosphatase A
VAPATFSCFLSIIIWYVLLPYKIAYIVVTVSFILLGIWLSDDLSKKWGKDPSQIVIDEYATLLIPLYFTPRRLLPLLVTFVLFRVFDILKPVPLRTLEKLPGGWGIMLDDIGAAIYTLIVVLVVFYFIPI